MCLHICNRQQIVLADTVQVLISQHVRLYAPGVVWHREAMANGW